MKLKPISFKKACDFVNTIHRHHKAPQGHKFSISVVNEHDEIIGVVMVGRPLSRYLDNGFTSEVTRMASDGTPNVCSMLYSAAWRASKAMGYTKIITYILETETGISLRASGWIKEADLKAQTQWGQSRKAKNRIISPVQGVNKQRWAVEIK